MKTIRLTPLLGSLDDHPRHNALCRRETLFNTEEILDESSLGYKILQDWHPVGDTRQKLIEINVAEWWPGQDYRIPVRMIVPLEGWRRGFRLPEPMVTLRR